MDPMLKSKPRIEGLSEFGLDSVEEGHCVQDTVEGQSSCLVIQVHSYYSGGAGDWYVSLFIIVIEVAARGTTLQTPGLITAS